MQSTKHAHSGTPRSDGAQPLTNVVDVLAVSSGNEKKDAKLAISMMINLEKKRTSEQQLDVRDMR